MSLLRCGSARGAGFLSTAKDAKCAKGVKEKQDMPSSFLASFASFASFAVNQPVTRLGPP
jgi:hypothetical protein